MGIDAWAVNRRFRYAGGRNGLLATTALVGVALAAPHAIADGASTIVAVQRGDAQEAQASESDRTIKFDIDPQPLRQALNLFGRQSGLQVTVDARLTDGVQANAVRAVLTIQEALQRLLAGSGLTWRFTDENTVLLTRAEHNSALQLNTIIVEGTAGTPATALDPVRGYRAEASKTLTRGALSLQELPNTVNVVTADSLKDRFARTSFDAIEIVPGVVRNGDNFGIEQFNIRGFNTGSRSFVASDGLLVTNQSPLDPAFIERYEVLKGPSSILNGQTAPGGTVNRVTKRAEFRRFTEAAASVGSPEFFRFEGDANAPLFEKTNLAGRMIVAIEQQDGFVDRTEFRRLALGPSLSARFMDGDARLTLLGRFQREGGTRSRGLPLFSDGSTPDIDRSVGVFGDDSDFDRGTDELFAEWDQHFLDNLRLNAKFGYQRSHLARQDIYAYQYDGASLDGTTTIAGGFIDDDTEIVSGELSGEYTGSAWGQDQQTLIGISASRRKTKLQFGYAYFGNDNLFDPANNTVLGNIPTQLDETQIEEQVGPFGQLILRPLEDLTIVAAGRYDFFESKNAVEDKQEAFTGRIGASYRILPNANVYASFAESFSTQSFEVDIGGQPLEPETGQQLEVGAKFDLLGGDLSLTTAAFHLARQNVARSVAGGAFSETVGEQTHRGIELELTGELLPDLSISAGYAFIDAEITEDPDPDREGSRPRAVSRHSGSLTLRYNVSSGPLQGAYFGGTAVGVGPRFVDDTEQAEIDGYVRGDLFAGYEINENVQTRLFIRNITDAQYIETPGYGVGGGNHFNEPLNVYATFSVKF